MPNAEKVNCGKCDGTGFLDYRGFSMDSCVWCKGEGTIEQSSKVAPLPRVATLKNSGGWRFLIDRQDPNNPEMFSGFKIDRNGSIGDGPSLTTGEGGRLNLHRSHFEDATVKDSLTVQAQERLEGLRQWADDNCPEGVSGAADDLRWLLTYAESVAAADLKQRLSDAVTLLYTHGVITEKMRAHARRNL